MNLANRIDMQARDIADHGGQLKGVGAAVAAVQSALSSWVAVVIGFGAALLAMFAVIAAFELYSSNKIDTKADAIGAKIETTNARIDTLNNRVDAIAQDVRLLPSAIAKEMVSVAGTISTMTRPVPANPPLPPDRR